MGEEAEALSEQLEDGSSWYQDSRGRERWGHKPRRQKKHQARRSGIHHHPASDVEAKALIQRLAHFEWVTHKVSGRYVAAPYMLTAAIGGELHTIHLPGRFGTTLTWLKGQVEAHHE